MLQVMYDQIWPVYVPYVYNQYVCTYLEYMKNIYNTYLHVQVEIYITFILYVHMLLASTFFKVFVQPYFWSTKNASLFNPP